MLNRNKKPWMGSWNGVGGKIQSGEEPIDGMIREIKEETDIDVHESFVFPKGVLTWDHFDALGNGLHIYVIELADDFVYETPRKTEEGILEWKDIDWIIDFGNSGIADNIPYFLPIVLTDAINYHYHCTFQGKILESVTKTKLD